MIHAGQRQIITDNNQQQKKYDEPSSAVLATDDGELRLVLVQMARNG